jgi:hypothetical protein
LGYGNCQPATVHNPAQLPPYENCKVATIKAFTLAVSLCL